MVRFLEDTRREIAILLDKTVKGLSYIFIETVGFDVNKIISPTRKDSVKTINVKLNFSF